jgi:deoxyribodipyrimidine photo-lyase
MWFRQDLRLSDNPAFSRAVATGAAVLPVYILDDDNAGEWALGAASRWWLHHSLESLNEDLDGGLHVLRGKADQLLPNLIDRIGASGVFWNRCYEPWRIARDKKIKAKLKDDHIDVRSCNGSVLFEPYTVTKADDTPYKVFTPFFKKGCLANGIPPREVIRKPANIELHDAPSATAVAALGLLPEIPWYREMEELWRPGEKGAKARLQRFLKSGIENYKSGRDVPSENFVSRLSPHLHFGELSPNQAWYAARRLKEKTSDTADIDHFLNELGWREFSHNQLYFFPTLPRKPLQEKFEKFPWREDDTALKKWQQGQTGIPMVDAGMRELWQTGYMHNRVRMIVGSFLIKNLLLHWHHGEDWFWDTLLDADLANNSASWQWVAGCGADAAPFFRIFNPVRQGERFDPDGAYVRQYIPELARLPDKFIHNPWEAPEQVLEDASIVLGEHYPEPIVDLKTSRERALAAFKSLKADT